MRAHALTLSCAFAALRMWRVMLLLLVALSAMFVAIRPGEALHFIPVLTTTLEDASTGKVFDDASMIPFGTLVHIDATLTGDGFKLFDDTRAIVYFVHDAVDCKNDPRVVDNMGPLADTDPFLDESAFFGGFTPGAWSIATTWAGDAAYNPAVPTCENFTILDPPPPDAVDDPTTPGPLTILEDAGPAAINGFNLLANDSGGARNQIDRGNVVFNTAGTEGTVTNNGNGRFDFQPNDDFFGTTTFTYTVMGLVSGMDTATVKITVTAVNDAPTLLFAGNPPAVNEDAGAQTVNMFVDTANPAQFNPGPDDENDGVLSFNIEMNSNPDLFSAGPAINPLGQLTYTPADDANGTAEITVTVTDTGGTENGGMDTSAEATFTITVNPINDPPTGTPDTYVVRVGQTLDVLAPGLLGNDIDIEIVALNLVGFSPLQVGTNANTGMFDIDPNVGGDGSFRFTAPATPGTVTFTYDLEDGGDGASLPLTSNGIMVTINVIVPQTLTVTKIVVNDGGGPLGVSDFPLFIDDELTTSGEDAMVTAGAHTVSETGDPDYTAVFSGACDADGNVTVAAGGTAECIITNTFVPLPPVPLPDLIFTDGFESGDTTMWSSSFPQGTNTGTYQGGGGTNTSGLRTVQGAAVPIADAVATIVGDYAAIFTYDAATKTFAVYRPDPALAFLNTLTTLTPGQAFFIEVTSPDGLVWEQAVSLTAARSIALVSGFNFVGWSGPELAPLEDAIAGIRDLVRSAFLWDPEAQEYLIYFRDAPAGINTLDVIPYSRAIWLFMDGAATWDQPARDG